MGKEVVIWLSLVIFMSKYTQPTFPFDQSAKVLVQYIASIILRCSKLYCDTVLLPIAFIILRYSKLYHDTTHCDILTIFAAFLCLLFLFPLEPAKHKFAKYFIFLIKNQSNISQNS